MKMGYLIPHVWLAACHREVTSPSVSVHVPHKTNVSNSLSVEH